MYAQVTQDAKRLSLFIILLGICKSVDNAAGLMAHLVLMPFDQFVIFINLREKCGARLKLQGQAMAPVVAPEL
jgi:hypothetical protein